jgi:spore maturation protein CgeB
MRIALFVHSLRSCWGHGSAHFLRGVAAELVRRGHRVDAWEPLGAWSAERLVREHGIAALEAWRESYPELCVRTYPPGQLDAGAALDGVDLALVHAWNPPELVARLGAERARRPGLRLLFHDTHHRGVTRPEALARLDLSRYDGVLAFGAALADAYRSRGRAARVFVWHEAADVRRFHPRPPSLRPDEAARRDVILVANWGDEDRTADLAEFFVEPVRRLRLDATVHGVRYPDAARAALAEAGAIHRGWIANHRVPAALAHHRATVHVPHRPHGEALPGTPTIRLFEALACGIPVVTAPWEDAEHLFRPGRDYLVARDGAETARLLRALREEPGIAAALAASGLETIRARHTCAHRVDELLALARSPGPSGAAG